MGAEQSHQLEKLSSNTVSDFQRNYISFFVNGEEYNVRTDGCDPDIGPRYLLVDYLRDKIGLTGTKYMCREGGCGSCIVTVKTGNTRNGEERSVNSCLIPLFQCDGLEITTVEALGNRQVGYSEIQQRLVKFGGTQCGFCTPGFVMNMHSVAQSNPRFTAQDVEYSFDGNICRCTGYRPIIEAFKSLSSNPSEELKWKCADIEDMYKCPFKPDSVKNKSPVSSDSAEGLEIVQIPKQLYIESDSRDLPEKWFKVTKLSTLYELLQSFANSRTTYRLVAGNTGTGVYKNDGPYDVYIDISNIPELQETFVDKEGITLGGGVTLTTCIDIFQRAEETHGFVYAGEFFDHFRRIANLAVRNRATIGGNLGLKHMHRDFRSDPFTLLESIGATVTIGFSEAMTRRYSLLEFLELDLTGKVVLAVNLPPLSSDQYFYQSYKIGKRYQNSVAYVNAGFLLQVDPRTLIVLSRPKICYGGVNPEFVHAAGTEQFLNGKPLNVSSLQGAMQILENEVRPDFDPAYGTIEYRKGLTQSLLYRFLLFVRGNKVGTRLLSGADELHRNPNTAKQVWETDPKAWPVNQPIPKLESFPQASGEAEYINDIRAELDELFGAFVVSTVANATIRNIDASAALAIPGVVDFVTAKDIPGTNNYQPFGIEPEEIFATRNINHAGQPIGLLVARDKYTAFQARSLVRIEYSSVTKPVLDIQETADNVKAKASSACPDPAALAFPCRGIDVDKTKKILENNQTKRLNQSINYAEVTGDLRTIKGEFRAPGQYHFHMETQIAICVPIENGMKVFSSTQHMDAVQLAIAGCLSVPNCSVVVEVRRLGGGFGAKLSKCSLIACAGAVAATKHSRPVRVALDLETNMQMIGKRLPYLAKYEMKVDDTGKIHQLEGDIWCDSGAIPNEATSLFAMVCSQSCYRADNWNVTPRIATTNTPPNTYCRGPGSAQGASIAEHLMEHIAFTLKLDPLQVRRVNFIRKGDPLIGVPGAKLPLPNLIPGMLEELTTNGDYESRKKYVEKFNKENRWKKRGLTVVCLRFPGHYQEFRFPVFISVYHPDGTVNVSSGGLEIGQGLNTKVAQVVAQTLGIPLDKIRVQPSNNVVSPNTALTAGSTTSELCCESARRACELLLEKLAPVRKALGNPTWEELIAAANAREILLTAQFQETSYLTAYDIWGTTMLEVEVDILTGDYKIVRADIIEDAGKSLNPLIDLGQVEGAFVMGLGWWTTEELIYDRENGQLLTDNTWHYKVYLPADIPEDFRVTLLRNAPNPYGVLSSKATGEPPLSMSCSVVHAIRHAINAAREEVGNYEWYDLDVPVTREVIRRHCLVSPDQFTF